MIETVVQVDGMMCGMCESHVNDAVRKAFPEAKKVASSHTKGQTVIQGRIEGTVREKRFFLVFEKINPETIS